MRRSAALLAASLALAGAGARALPAAGRSPLLQISPVRALVDQPVRIRVTGLRPRQRVTLEATTRDFLGVGWRSRLAFVADGAGAVDTRSSMRLFWTMLPNKDPFAPPAYALPRGDTPVLLRALVDGHTVGSGMLTRRAEDPDLAVVQTTISGQGFVGTFFARRGAPPGPAVLQIGGSAGGHSEYPAAVLASHGFPTLSLAYFGEPGLPTTLKDIPLEYFARAIRWLGTQPGVDPGRIAVIGVSRGAEGALLIGATYPGLVHGVVACTGSASVIGATPPPGDAWTLGGKPVPWGPIAVERIDGPILAFGGGEDAFGPSDDAVREIVARARAHGRRDVAGRIYPKAGHAVGCQIPNVPIGDYQIGPATYYARGGTRDANGAAAASAWPLVLRLLGTLPG